MGVGPGLRERTKQEIELVEHIPGDLNQIVVSALYDSAKTIPNLLGSVGSSFEEGNRSSEGWSDRIKKLSDYRAARAPL